MKLYLVDPGIVLWIGNTCRSLFFHKLSQGFRLDYIRYQR